MERVTRFDVAQRNYIAEHGFNDLALAAERLHRGVVENADPTILREAAKGVITAEAVLALIGWSREEKMVVLTEGDDTLVLPIAHDDPIMPLGRLKAIVRGWVAVDFEDVHGCERRVEVLDLESSAQSPGEAMAEYSADEVAARLDLARAELRLATGMAILAGQEGIGRPVD